MIIKIRGTGEQESWRYYDGAREVQSYLMDDEEPNCIHPQDVEVETFITNLKPMPARGGVICITFEDDGGTAHTIYANTTVYLLNDQGKTIERLL